MIGSQVHRLILIEDRMEELLQLKPAQPTMGAAEEHLITIWRKNLDTVHDNVT